MRQQIQQHLHQLQQIMQDMALWQTVPPAEEAFLSQQSFAIDYLSANEWLQWIFIPRMIVFFYAEFCECLIHRL